MSKIQSEKEKKLQKSLIPLNIFVCVLCLVAIFTLIFTPILKVDVGKILRDEKTVAFVDDKVDEMVGGSLKGAGATDINFSPVIASIVSKVLNSAEGSITISAYNASKVAFESGDNKGDKVLEELFFGENAMVTKLINSVVDGVSKLIKPDDGGKTEFNEVVEKAIVTTLTTQLVGNLGNENITEDNIKDLTDAFKGIENVEDGDVSGVVDNIVTEVNSITKSELSEEEKANINKEVQKIYDEAAAQLGEGEKVDMEAFVCVAVSKNLDLGDFNLGDIWNQIPGMNNGEPKPEEKIPSRKVVADEITDGTDGEGETPENPGEGETPDNPGEGETPENPGEGETPDNPGEEQKPENPDRKIVTSYSDLMTEIGFDDAKLGEMKDNLRTSLRGYVDSLLKTGSGDSENSQDITQYFGYYGYLFYGILAFALPWIVLFLFSLIHIFTKNKRFTMWYVKLFYFIPALISLALVIAPKILPTIPAFAEMLNSENGAIIGAALKSISSLMWISGLCYVLLWLASICWAFPIKHKIRKERKAVKQYGITDSYGSGPSDGGAGAPDLYGTSLDDDDGFNSPYSGSGYGGDSGYGYGSLFDDDDDDLF